MNFEAPQPEEEIKGESPQNSPEPSKSPEQGEVKESEERLEAEAQDLLEVAKMIGEERGDSEFPKELSREISQAKKVGEEHPSALPRWKKAVLAGTLAMSLFAAAPKPDAEARGLFAKRPTQEQVKDRRERQQDRWGFKQKRMQQEERRWRHEEQGWQHEERGLRHDEVERRYEERQIYYTMRRIGLFGVLIGRALGEILQ